MRKLNRKEWIGVVVGLGFIAYVFFGQAILNIFNFTMNQSRAAQISGVRVQDLVVGTGPIAEPGDTVTAHYVGKLADGRVFDSSLDRGVPISFTLGIGQVIRGWDEGLQGMRVGGTRVLTISPDYGYGANAVGAIPPNSTLTFQVQLVNIAKKK